MVEEIKKPEDKKTLLEVILKDTGVHIQVVEQQLKMVKKFKNNLGRIMLVANKSMLQLTLADYFNVTEGLLTSMLKNLNTQEQVLDIEKKRFDNISKLGKKDVDNKG